MELIPSSFDLTTQGNLATAASFSQKMDRSRQTTYLVPQNLLELASFFTKTATLGLSTAAFDR